MTSPVDFKTYRDFVNHELDSDRFGRGAKIRLAEFLGVQRSFVSSVLSGHQDFAPEHAMKVSEYLGLDDEDRLFFLNMIHHERAGTQDLKALYQKQLDSVRAERKKIKSQIKSIEGEEDEEVIESKNASYASAWFHTAVHMCIRNPKLRSPEAIARYLCIDRMQALHSLKVLEKIGFAKSHKGIWQPTVARFHLAKDSLATRAFHTNWRHMAVHSLDDPQAEDMHYSLVVSIDQKVFKKIREMILNVIRETEPLIAAAEDHEIVALNLDYFKLGRTV